MMFIEKTLVLGRGQSCTLKGEIFIEVDGEKVPYTMPINLRNPHLLLSIRNSLMFENKRGTIYNYYIPAETFILQTSTRVPEYALTDIAVNKKNTLYYVPSTDIISGKEVRRKYMYYSKGKAKEYHCCFKKTFHSIDTKRWREQDWYYSVSLVSGTLVTEYLQGLYDDIYGKPSEENPSLWTKDVMNGYKDKRWLYDAICSAKPEFEGRVDVNEYFASIDTKDLIQGDQKLVII